jgi:hypothetical protein
MTTNTGAADHGRAGDGMLISALALLLTFVIGLFAWYAHPFTADFPWLWRTGAVILNQGALPTADLFSWTHQGEPWLLYQWLFEVLIAAVVAIIGFKGLFALYQSIAIGLYVVAPLTFAVPRRVGMMQVLPPAIFALVLAPYNLSLRPMLASSALLLVQYVLLHRWRAGQIAWWVTLLSAALLYALWANLHLGVAIGLGSLMLFAVGDWLERRSFYQFTPADQAVEGLAKPLRGYAVLIATAIAASLLNPYGFGIYEYLWTLSAGEAMNGHIEELQSPDFHQHLPQFWLLFVTWTFGLIATTGVRRAISATDLLHLVVTALATFFAARFVVWSLLILALVLPRILHHRAILAGAADIRPDLRSILGRLAAVSAVLLPAALWAGPWAPALDPTCVVLKPGMAALSANRRSDDRLLNSPNLGSCLIFEQTSPAVFIDTRFDMYGDRFVADTAQLFTLKPGWRADLAKRGITLVALERGLPLIEALLADDRYQVLFADQGSAVIRLQH